MENEALFTNILENTKHNITKRTALVQISTNKLHFTDNNSNNNLNTAPRLSASQPLRTKLQLEIPKTIQSCSKDDHSSQYLPVFINISGRMRRHRKIPEDSP
ncbi:hypothetical protein AVEN_22969-1 [Araneus ventricosus]|uniref:Uncharacterized protein n=1 Tax=Araneus ventricosus TaxID=182803 RepID=A0A4Y2VKE9_ARAVE|nr:hypothetical protein AVEN_101543-1 [Araneus ventricosus]GBO25793.1 hypothetical protein AVEN_22969-1 [Araneus ventricosus]